MPQPIAIGQRAIVLRANQPVCDMLGASRVAQMTTQLSAQGALDQGLLEHHEASRTASAVMGPFTRWAIRSSGLVGSSRSAAWLVLVLRGDSLVDTAIHIQT